MKVTIKNGILTVEIPCDETASTPSKTGKTLAVASSNGNKPTSCLVKGKPLIVGVNAYIKP